MRQSSQSSSRRSAKPAAKRASVLPVLLSGIVLIGAGSVVAALGFPSPSPNPQPDPTPAPLSGSEHRVLLYRAGLDPETLTSIGLSSEQIGTLIGQSQVHLSTGLETLRTRQQALATARQTHDELYRKVQNRTATEQEVARFQFAKTTLTSSKRDLQTAFENLLVSSTRQLLTADQMQLLRTSISNKDWDVPQQYRIVARTEPEWVSLKRALAAKSIAERKGEPVPASVQQIIAAADSDIHVSNAAAWLRANSAQNHSVFEFVTNNRP